MYQFDKEALNAKLKECIAGYEAYRKMMLEPVDYTNPNALVERLAVINSHNASVGHLKSSFDFLVEKAVAIEMSKIDHDAMPAKKFDALVKDNVGLITVFSRSLEIMIKESHYMIESTRSILSFMKKELENIGGGA